MTNDFNEALEKSRILFINDVIDEKTSAYVVAKLLYLDSLNHEDISIYINSPGGSVSDGFAITDTMELLKSKVNTIGYGTVASMAAVILACGHRRSCLRHTRCMIHQIYTGMQGKASDVEVSYRNMLEVKNDVVGLLASKVKKSVKTVEKDCERDCWMSAQEAKDYGLIDEVL